MKTLAAGPKSGATEQPPNGAILSKLAEGACGTILANPDRKSREMGLAPGAHIRMQRNRRHDHAIVVAVGDARFFISRTLAARITLDVARAP